MMNKDKTKILTEPQKTDNDSLSVVEAQVIKTKARDLTKIEAKKIAYRYIDSWITEACREDTQFFDTGTEDSLIEYGYDVENEQHRAIILEAFNEMSKRFDKEFNKWKPKLSDYPQEIVSATIKLIKEGKL